MGAMTGLVAGIATIGGAVALYRFARKGLREAANQVEAAQRKAAEGFAGGGADGAVLDYRKDPADGVFRPKP